MKLYYSPGACSLAVHITLCETGLPFDKESVDLATKKTASGADFSAINAKGYVPALQLDGGELLTEGPAINQYLADLVPEKKLAPANGTLDRVRLQSWLTFIGTELHKSFSPLFRPGSTDDAKKQAKDAIANRLTYVNNQLAGKQYLVAEQFSVADAYLFTVVGWMGFLGMPTDAYSNIQALMARVGARPAVQAALKAEGLIK
jgi:glutathione S-transferase